MLSCGSAPLLRYQRPSGSGLLVPKVSGAFLRIRRRGLDVYLVVPDAALCRSLDRDALYVAYDSGTNKVTASGTMEISAGSVPSNSPSACTRIRVDSR